MSRSMSRGDTRIDDLEATPRRHTRTRTGCLNCRRRKRKCDEGRPVCGTCHRRSERCEWGLKITFRAENAQGIDGAHPSMRRAATESSPTAEFEIMDMTSSVIRNYHTGSELIDSDDEEHFRFDDDTLVERQQGTITRPPAPTSRPIRPGPYFVNQHSNIASPSSQRQTESAVANLIYLSQSGPPQASPDDPAIQPLFDEIPIDTTIENLCADREQAFASKEPSQHRGSLPGSPLHELRSTLRSHLFREVRSNVSTHPTALRLNTESNNDDSVFDDHAVEAFVLQQWQHLEVGDDVEYPLWRNWLDEIVPWLDLFDRKQDFRHVVSTMAHDYDYLRYSILSVSARQRELRKTNPPTDHGLALYQEAILQLLPHLPTRNIAVVSTCVILCVHGMLGTVPEAWRLQLDGCASLMMALGINGIVGGLEQALFWCFARMDVGAGLVSSEKTLIPTALWMSKATIEADVQLFRSADTHEQWANYALYLTANVLDLLAPLPAETLQAPARNEPNFRARWIKLWEYLCDWYINRPAPFQPIMTIPSSETSPFPTVLFSNPAAICGTQLHHTASILMLQNQPFAIRPAPKPRSILFHARQICGIGISNDHHGAWTNGVQPLRIAGRCMSHPSEHKAILELFERIERETGWVTRWTAEDLKDYWGDLEN